MPDDHWEKMFNRLMASQGPAVRHEGFRELPDLRQCQIFTNLVNQINTVGRFVKAQEYWNRALAMRPRFGMELGNRGYGLAEYARAPYDTGSPACLAVPCSQVAVGGPLRQSGV